MAGKRLVTLGAIFGLAWTALAARVFWVQVLQSGHYSELEAGQSQRRHVLLPRRGEIFDRAGNLLVANMEESGGASSGLSAKGGRICPNGPMAGQVLGVVSRDGYGQSGLEFHLDRDLRGTDGWRYARFDSRKRYAPGTEDRANQPVDGLGVTLTLDAKVQEITELALERGVRRSGAKQGVAIVVEPASGDILAMANVPFFNPNSHDGREGVNWKNQAVVKFYEPGSTFKIITAAALLEERRMAPADTVDAEGGEYQIAGETIRDTHPLGRISFTDALAHSSNIAFAKMSARLQPVVFYKYIRSFGFGMKTGVSLPAEESGLLKPLREWSGRSQPTLAFGHEIAVTPLQMIMAAAAVANGGMLMRPRLVKAWVDGEGKTVREESTREVRRVVSEATAATLRSMLRAVVEYGTAAEIRHPYIPIAGKTGTAEKIDAATGKYVKGLFNSSFVGMAPADKPAFVCLVLLDEPEQLKYGGQSAAPVFREILDRLIVEWNWFPTNTAPPASPPLAAASFAPPRTFPSSASVMPDLTNATLRDALLRLREIGAEVEYTGEGRVVGQQPAPGMPLRRGMLCRITLGWMG